MKKYLYFVLLAIPIFCSFKLSALKIKKIKVKDVTLVVEVARTSRQRAKGLMFRRSLPFSRGMIFVYGEEEVLHFWMKNTYIPLDIGFFDKFRVLRTVKTMIPHDLTAVSSEVPVKYALEVNKGWFKRNNIKVGDVFRFLN